MYCLTYAEVPGEAKPQGQDGDWPLPGPGREGGDGLKGSRRWLAGRRKLVKPVWRWSRVCRRIPKSSPVLNIGEFCRPKLSRALKNDPALLKMRF